MFEDPFVRSLGMLLVTAAIFGFLARLVRLPAVVGYLLAGLVLGPLTGMVEVGESLAHVSEAGIALLLFVVGLELNFAKVRDVGRIAAVAGLAQVALTSLGGFVFCTLLGFGPMESAFFAAALTFSSTVVVVKLLDERRELDALHGRIALGILLVQDVVVIVLLTLLAGLGDGARLDLASIARGLALALGGMAALLAFVLLAARYLLPRPLAWAARSPEMLLIWSLCWCFGLVLAAERLGLSLEIGAFLAGISLAQLPYSHDLRRRVHPLMNFFIAVFLVSLGIKTELRAVLEHWPTVVLLSLFVLLCKAALIYLIVSRLGLGSRTSFLTGTALAQVSEFSFILVALGVKDGLIGQPVLSITALVGLPTIAISAWLINHGEALHRLARSSGFFRHDDATHGPGTAHGAGKYRDHIIIVGMNTLGRLLVRRLTDAGERVLAIDTDPRKLAHLPCDTLLGNVGYLPVLEEAGLPHAKLLIAALRIEETNDLLAYRCRSYGVPCAIHVVDMSQTDNLLEMDADYLMIPKVDGVKLMNRELARMGFLAR